jgi:subtilisin family serine protease
MKLNSVNYFTKWVLLLVLPLLAFGFNSKKEAILNTNNALYMSNTVVIKLKDKPVVSLNKSVLLSDNLNKALNEFKLNSTKSFLLNNNSGTSLDRIIIVKYNSNQDPLFVAKQLRSLKEVEWAEPKFVYKVVDFTPNDPGYGNQYSLPLIKAPAAWNIIQGDTSVIIGIVDTGVDWPHPDLSANIWHNWGETPNNGIDDDHNGYIDDVRGWDFGGLGNSDGTPTPDNDPMEDNPDHGTHVAGIASAVTNNSVGIASIGFKCKIMPVKTTQNNYRDPISGEPYIVFGFEGIVYAVDNHAKVINCSWGGGGYSLLGQETINYAISKGALVVCAAGNDNSSEVFYPANYVGVLSVAATDQNDARASFSNYGHGISVCAPGVGIYSTWQPNTYALSDGTSMASPLAAGLAALVTAKFPQYTPEQVREQVRVNCDDISSLNPGYVNLLGRGRINAFKSVSNINSESVRAIQVAFSDEAPGGNNNGILEPGETITVNIQFKNYLSNTSSLAVSLESKNNSSTVVNGNLNKGAVGTLQTFDNSSSKFTFTLPSTMPNNVPLDFLLHFSDGTYSDFQWISATGNPNYATQTGNDISLTITSAGNLGFNDYDNNLQGTGFHFGDGPNYMFEGSLMLANSSTKVVDNVRNSNGAEKKSFLNVQPFKITIPSSISDIQGSTLFNDNIAAQKFGVDVKLQSYSFIDPADQNYIILRYTITNTSGAAISNLYAGLYFDWDMIEGSGANDLTAYDSIGNFGYVHHQGLVPDTTIGIGLLSASNYGFYAIMNSSFGYTELEKWTALSSGFASTSAGPADIANVTSSGPYNIPSGSSIDVAFALAADVNLPNLRTAFANARTKYNSIITSVNDSKNPIPYKFELAQNYPNPFNPSTIIKFSIPSEGQVIMKIYDMLGREVRTLLNEEKAPGNYSVNFIAGNLPSGVYLYKLTAGNYTDVKKLILIK